MKIIKSKDKKEWSARIRCAQSGGYLSNRVNGCFTELEISKQDIKKGTDSEGDSYLYVTCPICNMIIYFENQLAETIQL